MKIKLDPGAFMLERAHATDAGLDIKSPKDCIIPAHDSVTIYTGVHVKLPPNTAGLLVSKSGLNTRYNITSTGSLIIKRGIECASCPTQDEDMMLAWWAREGRKMYE